MRFAEKRWLWDDILLVGQHQSSPALSEAVQWWWGKICAQNNKWCKCHRGLSGTEHKLVFLFRRLWRRTPANRTNTAWRTLTWQSIDRCLATSPSRSTNSSLRWQKASYNQWLVSYIRNNTEEFVHLGFWTGTILHKTKIHFDFWVVKLSINSMKICMKPSHFNRLTVRISSTHNALFSQWQAPNTDLSQVRHIILNDKIDRRSGALMNIMLFHWKTVGKGNIRWKV